MSIAKILFFLGFVYFLFLSFREEFQSFKTSLNFLLCLIQFSISSYFHFFLHSPMHSILLPAFIIRKLPLFLAFSTISYLQTYRSLTYTTSQSIVVPCHSMRRSTHRPRTGDDLDYYSLGRWRGYGTRIFSFFWRLA